MIEGCCRLLSCQVGQSPLSTGTGDMRDGEEKNDPLRSSCCAFRSLASLLRFRTSSNQAWSKKPGVKLMIIRGEAVEIDGRQGSTEAAVKSPCVRRSCPYRDPTRGLTTTETCTRPQEAKLDHCSTFTRCLGSLLRPERRGVIYREYLVLQ